jgi:hypothetical protein
MGNQQPRFLDGKLRDICINAMFGDGYYWKHPECKNWKVIFTSTNYDFLEIKMNMNPDVFPSNIKIHRKAGAKNCFANSKTLYGLQSLVNEDFTEASNFKGKKESLFQYLSLKDFGLWYLDDGGFMERTDSRKFTPRFFLCVGDCCGTKKKEGMFKKQLNILFGENNGTILFNGSQNGKSSKNKVWYPTIDVGYELVKQAKKLIKNCYKFPSKDKVQRLSRKGVGE